MILKSTASPLVIQATPHFGTLSSFVTNTFHPLSHTIYTAFKMVGFNCKSNPVVNPSIQDFPGGPVVRTRHANCWGAWVQSLLGELKSHRSHSAAKKKKKNPNFLSQPSKFFLTDCADNLTHQLYPFNPTLSSRLSKCLSTPLKKPEISKLLQEKSPFQLCLHFSPSRHSSQMLKHCICRRER